MARASVAGALALLVVTALHAQVFKTDTELVTIPVTVTDRGNERVSGLVAENFRVFEDGAEQTVSLVDEHRRAVSLCIVLDSSQSMGGWKQRQAAIALDRVVAGLQPEDEVALVVLSAVVEVAVPWTPARKFPKIDWQKWEVGGSTPLIDALSQGLATIETAKNPRPVFLVISDGLENASQISLNRVITTRRQSEISVYAFRTEDRRTGHEPRFPPFAPGATAPPATRGIDVLPTLVGDSGGVVYDIPIEERAVTAAQTLFAELGSQYVVGYVPKKPLDGKYRRLKVEVSDKRWRVRHRGGYLAMPHSTSRY
jgi:VWFA-related protein